MYTIFCRTTRRTLGSAENLALALAAMADARRAGVNADVRREGR